MHNNNYNTHTHFKDYTFSQIYDIAIATKTHCSYMDAKVCILSAGGTGPADKQLPARPMFSSNFYLSVSLPIALAPCSSALS